MKTWMHGIAAPSALRALICACVLSACSDAPTKRDAVATSKAPLPSQDAPCVEWTLSKLAAPGAFDLALTTDGAWVVWSPEQGGLQLQLLDRRGGKHGAVRPLLVADGAKVSGHVIEVTAASAAGEIGVAWVEAEAGAFSARVGRGNERALDTIQAQELGPVEPAEGARGRVLIASTDDGELQVTWRNERSNCQAQSGVCSHYTRRAVGPNDASTRGVIAREMLEPCDSMLIGSLWADGSWYEAVCHRNPEPMAYLFSFRPEISYAEATELLAGCRAFTTSRAAVGAALWAQCSDGVAVAARSHLPATPPVLRGVTETIRCDAARPVLVAKGAAGAFELPLTAATDSIGAALSDVPFEARAVWTGTHVIAAFEDHGALRVVTGACGADGFVWCGALPRP